MPPTDLECGALSPLGSPILILSALIVVWNTIKPVQSEDLSLRNLELAK
jgi:hypothetical protein